ncbi:CDP-glycerol glycerophosphotransferase family protein [Cytobacillus sp. Hm23]
MNSPDSKSDNNIEPDKFNLNKEEIMFIEKSKNANKIHTSVHSLTNEGQENKPLGSYQQKSREELLSYTDEARLVKENETIEELLSAVKEMVAVGKEIIPIIPDTYEENHNDVDMLPIVKKMIDEGQEVIPNRVITNLSWNGAIMDIKGYYYLQDIPLVDEDLVKKRLILINEEKEKIAIPLRDVAVGLITDDKSKNIDVDVYKWAGFNGTINFATITKNALPLPAALYKIFIEIEIQDYNSKKYSRMYPLGNIEKFLHHQFYTTKMEYFSNRKEMRYNLLASYDEHEKTLALRSTQLMDIDPSRLMIEKNKSNGLIYKIIKTIGFRGLYSIFKLLPMQKNKVLFASDSRTEMSGNFEFVYEEMQSREFDWKYRFLFKEGIAEKKTIGEIVELAYHLATSKVILLDDFYPMVYPLTIRKNAELIQLWHAVGAFKKFGFSRIGLPGGPSPKSKNHRNYTKAIVSSDHIGKYYAEGFGIDREKVVATGIPRTDVFFDKTYQEEVREQLYNDYPFLRGKKVITFAPTFRGNGQQSAYYPMEVLNLHKLYESLSDEYVFLFKLHPFIKNDFSIPYQYGDFFYDFSSYREINDLLFITDVLITDYSSVCFEYALLNKPMIFFSYDVEEYVQKRDFYFEYQSFIPGPLVRSTKELIETIINKNFEMHKIKPFVDYFFDDVDGMSSTRVVDQLILELGEEVIEEG